jgi:hypothetical protein
MLCIQRIARSSGRLVLALGSSAILGCGGGGSGASDVPFRVVDIDVADGAVWPITRPIRVRFSRDVDFGSVSLNTIGVRQPAGTPAVGQFSLIDGRTLEFQPRCPLASDLSDAGLVPGGVAYELRIFGSNESNGLTVRSRDGATLRASEARSFTTPIGTLAPELFFDTRVGPPRPLIRDAGDSGQGFTHIQVGPDPGERIYFERAPDGTVALAGNALLDLNLHSDLRSRVALKLYFDQPVQPFDTNINARRLPWQYRDQQGTWTDLTTEITLLANCGATGAVVEIRPLGALPPGALLRSVITTEFADLVGETNGLVLDTHAPATTRPPPALLADALQEEFLIGGTSKGSREDATAGVGEPLAAWGDGRLTPPFAFEGTGGNGGDFDWEVKPGQTFVLDTTTTTIVGGPGFVPTKQQVVVNGVLDVRNLRIGAGARVQVQGPNPLVILASGRVEILGELDLGGTDNIGVVSLITASIPEPGATGNAGGGRGGTGSPLTTTSSPSGTRGFGAFNAPDGGGQGGESGWNASNTSVDALRGAGGGGGVFGANQAAVSGQGAFDQHFIGLDAEPGFVNTSCILVPPPPGTACAAQHNPPAKGAISGVAPPLGGGVGPSPFFDPDPTNDFFGHVFDTSTGLLLAGELQQPWAGAGGGGGGDACFTAGQPFPAVPFTGADSKGAGGGGGGGSLMILALGDIKFGNAGQIRCRGGTGGGGGNTNFLDRVGGGSGGGSGGHVILQTAAQIDMSLTGTGSLPASHDRQAVVATGGEGGSGRNNQGGATIGQNGSLEKPVNLDACPPGYPTTGANACVGHVDGAGGDGGPGIIQLHTPNGLAGGDILLPPGKQLADICKPTPIYATATQRLVPTFGRNSTARSVWIPIGLGGFDPAATSAPFFKGPVFEFQDTHPASGLVQTTNGIVEKQPPLLGPDPIQNPGQGLPFISPTEPRTIVMDASGLVGTPNEVFLENLGLTQHFVLELSQTSDPSVFRRFDVVAASYDVSTQRLTLHSSTEDPPLNTFTPPGGPSASLSPSFFRIRTEGTLDALPPSASVRIRFQATGATAGVPDLAKVLPPDPTGQAQNWATDPAALNVAGNHDLRYFRFEVRFDIDATSAGLTPANPIPTVEFLRFPVHYQR